MMMRRRRRRRRRKRRRRESSLEAPNPKTRGKVREEELRRRERESLGELRKGD